MVVLRVFLLHSIKCANHSRLCGLPINVENHNKVRPSSTDCDIANRKNVLSRQAASTSLICKRRRDESIRQDECATSKCRKNSFFHQLCAACHIKEHLAASHHFGICRIKQHSANLFADGRTAWFSHFNGFDSCSLCNFRHRLKLRALPAAIWAVKDDESPRKK